MVSEAEQTRASAGRPAWKRAARRLRDAGFRLLTPFDRLVHVGSGALLPPAHLRIYYYRTLRPSAFARACADARTELMSRGLRPEHRVLDIGCGIGNLALGLAGYLRGGYDGLDIHAEAVDWCQRAITARHPSFRFHRADLASRAYNPGGHQMASSYRFPFADRTFDFVFLGSVFTHLLPDTVEQYLAEIARVLDTRGTCVASYFLLNDDNRPAVEAGRSFIPFPVAHPSGRCRLHKAAVPEAAVAMEEGYVREVHDRVGLEIRDVRRGGWATGTAHDQDVLTARREA